MLAFLELFVGTAAVGAKVRLWLILGMEGATLRGGGGCGLLLLLGFGGFAGLAFGLLARGWHCYWTMVACGLVW